MRWFPLLLLTALILPAQERKSSCDACPEWNEPQKPFQIYGNSYYVGPHGLTSILITSPNGHILIDGDLPESVPQILDHIRALNFRPEDIKLIVTSHAHFDHAGGVAELQTVSHARVAASPWTADVMRKGAIPPDDPQYKTSIIPIARISKVDSFDDGAVLSVGKLQVTAHLTPGHTPGGTSYTWQSCQDERCLNLVYADSLSPVSRADFRFTGNVAASFERSFAFLESASCDILLTPHPDASNLWDRYSRQNLINPSACRDLAKTFREQLAKRLATEKNTKH